MILPRSLSSGAFRFALVMALVFGAGAMALLVTVKHAIAAYTADAVEDAVSSEVDILLAEERELGRAELIHAIFRHEHAVREKQLRYLLVDVHGGRLAGTLPLTFAHLGWSNEQLRECSDHPGCVIPLLVMGTRLPDGAILVVANDTSDLVLLRYQLSLYTIGFGLVIGCLVLLGGIATGGVFVRRLSRVNGAIDRIVAGRFAERLPRIGMGPEFDQLSANLNVMLDTIEQLMDGLRQVSVDIAHDLRTPLTRLRQRLERLQEKVDGEVAADVEATLSQADQILEIFSALLRIGSLESGAAAKHFTEVDLSELLSRMSSAYTPAIEDSGRILQATLPPGVLVHADQELLGQAIANLIENALTHTPESTNIKIGLITDAGSAKIIVEDNGPGIPIEERERVLRRFYRLDRSRSTPGAGLGLSLAAAIAALHGGILRLEDAGPGLRAVIQLANARSAA